MFLCPQLWLLPVKMPWVTQGNSLTPKMVNTFPVSKGRDLFRFNPLVWVRDLAGYKTRCGVSASLHPSLQPPLPFFLSAVGQSKSCWSQTPDTAQGFVCRQHGLRQLRGARVIWLGWEANDSWTVVQKCQHSMIVYETWNEPWASCSRISLCLL